MFCKLLLCCEIQFAACGMNRIVGHGRKSRHSAYNTYYICAAGNHDFDHSAQTKRIRSKKIADSSIRMSPVFFFSFHCHRHHRRRCRHHHHHHHHHFGIFTLMVFSFLLSFSYLFTARIKPSWLIWRQKKTKQFPFL